MCSFLKLLQVLRRALESRLTAPIVLEQPVTDLVEIVGQDSKSDIPLKARPPFIGAPIQSMVLQGIDVGFDGTVLPP